MKTERWRNISLAVVALCVVFAGRAPSQSVEGGIPPLFLSDVGYSEWNRSETNSPFSMQEVVTGSEGERKNVGLGVIYSLLLPGMGELYAGGYESGKYFTIAEGVLWLTLGIVDAHAGSLQDDAVSYAAQHAGFSPNGKDDQYFIDVGNFNDVYAFNEQVLRDRDAYKLYDPTSSDYWRWDSPDNREVYRDQRVASDEMYNNTRFVAAAIAVNHVISAINAARLVVAHNKSLSEDIGLDIRAKILGDISRPHGIALSFTRTF